MWTRRKMLAATASAGLLLGIGRRAMTDKIVNPKTAPQERQLDGIFPAPGLHMVGNGFRVAGYFSAIPDAFRRMSPFLLLDYHPTFDYAATTHPRGVGVHPHRGFETVTLAWQGSVAHHDSTGAGGIVGPGDVQWMTAASGILHKEYHEESYAKRGGPFQMAQLWVNLPRVYKMSAAGYQPILSGAIGVAELPGGAGHVRVIAGDYRGVRGPARTFTPIDLFDVRLRAGGSIDLDFPAFENVGILVMSGEVAMNRARAATNDFALWKNAGERITVAAGAESQLLVMAGEPIDEPVVPYGPFVMNDEREIRQAISDFNSGKFGYLAD